MRNYKIIAVDFDGTLCEDEYPYIGNPNLRLITMLKQRKLCGDKLILWTCRTGPKLKEAHEWCDALGLYFDAVNENLPEIIDTMGGDTRKIFADIYLDDKNICIRDVMSRYRMLENTVSLYKADGKV